MTTFAVTDPDHTLGAINYLLSNLNSGNVSGNVTIPGNVLVANSTTGVVSLYGNATPISYLYQWVNLRYSNNATGTDGFSTTPTNYNWFGIYNSSTQTPSSNPAAYSWYEVDGGFGSTKTIYYSAIGGRQVIFAAANSLPSSDYVISQANVAINLDVVTTAAGTPGERGPVENASVITPSDPTVATSSTLTTWFSSPRTANTAPIGTGLSPPVVNDNATFTYIDGNTNPSATYTFNGSIWVPSVGQVVNGNVIITGTIAGNAIIANTITATQIATDSITGNKIAGNTITGNLIAGNTITATNIAVGANITGNMIAAGTITANNLAANTLTANTVVSTGAQLGNITSQGFWLDGPTGTARFGNALYIGNSVTIGGLVTNGNLNANTVNTVQIANGAITTDKLAAGTIVVANSIQSNNAVFGSYTSPGFWLDATTGNARFGGNLSIGNSVTIGNIISFSTYTANSITSSAIAPFSITFGKIANGAVVLGCLAPNSIQSNAISANTMSGNIIQAGTLNANAIIANTFTANTINGNAIVANSITATQISTSYVYAGTISANNITAGTIASNVIYAGTVAATNITAGTLASNVIYAGNIVSTGATLGDNNSAGYWLRYTDGSARFGGSVSIGNNLTVGNLITASSLNSNVVTYTNLVKGLVPAPVGTQFITPNVTVGPGSSNYTETTASWYDKVLAYTIIPYSPAYATTGPTLTFTFTCNMALTASPSGPSFPYIQMYVKGQYAGGSTAPGGTYTGLTGAYYMTSVASFNGAVTYSIRATLPTTYWTSATSCLVGVGFFASLNGSATATITNANWVVS